MRIAISSEENIGLDSKVSHHFGRCAYFVLVDVDNGQVQKVDNVANPFFHQHRPGQVPGFIHDQKADVMISGGMGGRAIDFFQELGIETATGAAGTAQESLDRYFADELPKAQACRDSIEHGEHGHHHH